jgi:hypothetical protein
LTVMQSAQSTAAGSPKRINVCTHVHQETTTNAVYDDRMHQQLLLRHVWRPSALKHPPEPCQNPK